MNLVDGIQRQKAIDPKHSYIVQAPAGSGKTEILTQRFLKLLSQVSAPEQIIALTFTRKAANEMRERVVLALTNVVNGIKPVSPHQQDTYNYAVAALARDKEMQWNLLQQPARLRIITLDSLCQTIANAIPLQENQTPFANISNNPQVEYLTAAKACLNFAAENPEYSQAITNILEHIDNRQDNLQDLLCDLLGKREQWLGPLYQAKSQDKSVFEDAIKWIEKNELKRFQQTVPNELALELVSIVHDLYQIIPPKDSTISNWDNFKNINSTIAENLADLLLTSQNSLRKSFDHHIGFKKGICSDAIYKDIKERSKILLATLADQKDFVDALQRVRNLPKPEYNAGQWQILQSLFTLLPLLAAHLNILFNLENTVDFTAISEQSLLALGDEQNPTNLTLYLDNKISHILVDEFQDTSIQQYKLLRQLVEGWEPGDGRTLFIVGDPMQSIYRFRAAEVGLFLKVRDFGLGPVELIPLELACNFRSSTTIVNWVNLHFKNIFPKINDIRSGAITYAPSSATKSEDETCYIKALQFDDEEAEAISIINLVEEELELYPEDNIAILAKSRRQLKAIMQNIRKRKIPFQGVDIDLLANLPHLRDINSLTEALLMPANRLAWLSLLRSPWCGISLEDIYLIANFSKKRSIYYALSKLKEIKNLSEDGRNRASFIYSVLQNALRNRHQQAIVDWILDTLEYLHIEQVLTSDEQDDLEQYWMLIEQFELDGEISNWLLFKEQFHTLYSKKASTARLQIMTIHKSKGLEFDSVIIPGVGAKSALQDQTLLRWLTLPTDGNNDIFLLSPIKSSFDESCSLYNYLGKIDNEKSAYELQRLLYVAVTRAKKRLYLTDNKSTIRQGSFRQLLSNLDFKSTDNTEDEEDSVINMPNINHLPIDFYTKQGSNKDHLRNNPSDCHIPNSRPRLIGIVSHSILQWICNNHPQDSSEIPWELAASELTKSGFTGGSLTIAIEQLQSQIDNLYQDSIGKWIIKQHQEEKNEFEMLIQNGDIINTKIIDRTFYDKETRWIIDFKTGKDNFSTEIKHKVQLDEYARLFSRTDKNIKCGLYYLSNNHWVEWDYKQDTQAIKYNLEMSTTP
ncbi:MAG: UvrD-helicase domain-containing protein [Legionellaceae bacterium]|nr:UvrD-helicase domain-containing protein [Legionellaceae bacterium]